MDPLALRHRGDGEHLCGAEHLAKALVLAKIEGAIAAFIDPGNHDRTAIGETKLISHEWRNSPSARNRMVEVVARVERGIANEFKNTAMHLIDA